MAPPGDPTGRPATQRDWRSVADETPDATISHTRAWLRHLTADGRWHDISRAYPDADGRAMVLPLLRQSGRPAQLAMAASLPPASGFGGLISARVDADDAARAFADLATITASAITVKPPPEQCDAWAAAAPSSVIVEPRMTQILELGGDFDTTFGQRVPRRTRTRVRKGSRAGVSIEGGTTARLLDDYEALHRSWAERRAAERRLPTGLARAVHDRRNPRARLDSLVDHLGSAVTVWVARHDGRAVAAAIQLTHGAHSLFWRGCSDHDRAGPVEANYVLQATMIAHACEAGCRWYHLGDSGGVASLEHFKRRFGADEVAHATFHLDRLPVTRARRLGHAAIARIERLARRR